MELRGISFHYRKPLIRPSTLKMLFDEAYYQYYPELVRYGRQLQMDESDVEDLVQETFMRLHVELSKKVVPMNALVAKDEGLSEVIIVKILNPSR
jgi:hypothetical protein